MSNSSVACTCFIKHIHIILLRNEYFVAFLITLEDRCSSLIMTDFLNHSHEDVVISHTSAFFFLILLLLSFLLQEQNRSLSAISRLESVSVKVYACNYTMIMDKPFSDITKSGRTKNRVRQNDAHTTTGSKQLCAALNKEYLRRNR